MINHHRIIIRIYFTEPDKFAMALIAGPEQFLSTHLNRLEARRMPGRDNTTRFYISNLAEPNISPNHRR